MNYENYLWRKVLTLSSAVQRGTTVAEIRHKIFAFLKIKFAVEMGVVQMARIAVETEPVAQIIMTAPEDVALTHVVLSLQLRTLDFLVTIHRFLGIYLGEILASLYIFTILLFNVLQKVPVVAMF